MKALENLGRIAGVGLFSERIDINITHRTVKDIETDLLKTLEMYGGAVEEVAFEEKGPKSIGDLDVDAELADVVEESDEPGTPS
jgi:hypothetical protein